MADEARNTDNQNSWKPRTLRQSGGLASSTTRKIVRRLQTTADRTMVGPWKSPLRRPAKQKAALREHVEHSHEFAHHVKMRHRGRSVEQQATSGQAAELTLAQSALDVAPGTENVVRGPSIFTAGQAIPPVGGSLSRAETPSPASPAPSSTSSASSSSQSAMGPGTVILPMAKRSQASTHKESQTRRPVHRPGSRIFSRVQEGKATPETQVSASEPNAKDTGTKRSRSMEHQDSTESSKEALATEPVDEQASQTDVIQRRADASTAQRSMRTEVPSSESETLRPNAPASTQTPIQRKSDSSSTRESASALPTEPKSETKNLDPRAIWAARDKAGATAPPVSLSSATEMPIQRKAQDQSVVAEPSPDGLAPMAEQPVERLSQSSQSEETSSRASDRSISVQSSRTTPEASTKAPRRLRELITGSESVAEQSGTAKAEAKPILTPTEPSLSTPADMPVIQAKRERSEVDQPSGNELSSGDSIEGAPSQQVRSERVPQEKALQAPREATSRSTTAKAAPSSLQPTPHSEAVIQRKAAPEQTKNEQRVDREHITLPEPAKPEQRVEESSGPSAQAATPIAADETLPESSQSAKVSREDMPLRQRSVAPSPPQPDKTAQSEAESTEAIRPERLSAPESKVASSELAQPPAAAPAFIQEQPIQRKPTDQGAAHPAVESKAVESEIPANSIEPKQPGKALEQGSAETESESASSEMPLAIQRKAISTPESQMPTAPVEMSKPSSISSEQLHGEAETESSKASTAQVSQRAPQSTTEARQPSSADTRAAAKDEKNVEAKPSVIVSPTQSDMPLVHKPSSRQRWAPQTTTPTPQPSVAPEQPIQRKTVEPLVESRPAEDRTLEPRTSGHPVQDRTVKETTAPSSEPQVERLASDETSRSKSPTHQPVVAPPEMVLSKTPTRRTDPDSTKAETQSTESTVESTQESKPASVPVPFVPRASRKAKEQAQKLATKAASANAERSSKTGHLAPTEELVQRITGSHKYSTKSGTSDATENSSSTAFSTRRKSDGTSNVRSGRVFGAMPLVQLPKVNKEERERPEFKSRGVAHNLSAHATQQVIQRKAAPAAEVDNGDEIDYADLARRVYPHLKRMLVIEKERRPGGR